MKVQETSFREWVMWKARKKQSLIHRPPLQLKVVRRPPFRERSGADRRVYESCNNQFNRNERRRIPERRIPEVIECSMDEFKRWRSEK